VGLYEQFVLPHLLNFAMRNPELQPCRDRLTAPATGRVLEIGVGSGLNLRLYSREVCDVLGLEPSTRFLNMARRAAGAYPGRVKLIAGSAEAVPLDADSVDTVVTAWTLCSIPDVAAALSEMRRVLKPSGQLLFVEHGLAPDHEVRKWQHRLTPVSQRIAGGCRMNRPIQQLIERAGFAITHIDTHYVKGPRVLSFFYEGRAERA
jgi:ubiquinone/menaquinone biosynthesis C-methylase UbiE